MATVPIGERREEVGGRGRRLGEEGGGWGKMEEVGGRGRRLGEEGGGWGKREEVGRRGRRLGEEGGGWGKREGEQKKRKTERRMVRLNRQQSQTILSETNQGGRASYKLVGLRAVVETCPPQESCDSTEHEPEEE